jgi:hypothetical protein
MMVEGARGLAGLISGMAPLITRAIRRQLITAARHFDQHAVIPGHGEIVAMAPAAIYSCVVGDSCTEEAIDHELADIGAAPDVASTSAVMATRSAPFPVNRREFVAVIRRHVLGDSEPSAWTTLSPDLS